MPTLEHHATPVVRGPVWAYVWYATTLGGWLTSWGMARLEETSTASLVSLAIFAELVSVAVRWKYLSRSDARQPASPNKTAAELAWLCAWGGQANALGAIAMLSPTLASMLPALMVTGVIEALLLPRAPFAWKGINERSAEGFEPETGQTASAASIIELGAPEVATDESEEEPWTRSMHEGRAANGQSYLSGWVRFEFAAHQKTLTLAVGFSPAFSAPPDVELDQEVDSEESHCEAVVEHVTPAGMRVAIKRSSPGTLLTGKLLWHAAQSEHSSSLLSSRLP